ncbi:MAG TPA: hypothetical protein PLM53_08335 [Spirochaetota bacterium]|nr:hypothetical protein [Spirochaetota bacterium]HPC41596.1 hypothetical protein [Spirochaetota bacterium]HPL15385.1 hypothetical protein [Spirochaetota bacterium]HQF08294.1 hypothetical protein [Spirochaetota bacterium]HQH97091.1 hypothetical protein [Spirochaetota bacterium]
MEDSDKIKLVAVEDTESGKKIAFASFLRKDYVAKSLVIYIDGNNIITGIFFSSDVHGTVEWINGSGLKNCHRWESEDQARSRSYLTRRYTAILSDGSASADFARDFIIPDILDNMENADAAEWIADILRVREYLVPVDLSRFRVN